MMQTRSTCPYCGVGCGVIIESDGTQITGVRGDPEHPANLGRLCTKGSTLHLTAAEPVTRGSRLLQPMLRLQRGAAPQPIDWTRALDTAADRIADVVRQHGPDAVGLYLSGSAVLTLIALILSRETKDVDYETNIGLGETGSL